MYCDDNTQFGDTETGRTSYGAYGISECKNKIKSKGDKEVTKSGDKLSPAPGSKVQKSLRNKPGTQFFVTISFDFQPSVCERLNLVNNLEYFESNNSLISYCCATEYSRKSTEFDVRLDCFAEYKFPVYAADLSEYLRSVYLYQYVDCEPCRSKRNCFKYLSKEDTSYSLM